MSPGPHLALADDGPVAVPGAGVRRLQAGEGRLLLRALPRRRIDVQHAAARGGSGLAARPHLDVLDRLPRTPSGSLMSKSHFVFGVGLEVEDAAGEHLGHGVVEPEIFAEHPSRRRSAAAAGPVSIRSSPDLR